MSFPAFTTFRHQPIRTSKHLTITSYAEFKSLNTKIDRIETEQHAFEKFATIRFASGESWVTTKTDILRAAMDDSFAALNAYLVEEWAAHNNKLDIGFAAALADSASHAAQIAEDLHLHIQEVHEHLGGGEEWTTPIAAQLEAHDASLAAYSTSILQAITDHEDIEAAAFDHIEFIFDEFLATNFTELAYNVSYIRDELDLGIEEILDEIDDVCDKE
jgi:hypothetical protein